MCLDIINILDILRILDWGWLATCSDFDGGGAEGAPPCRSRIISWVSKASKTKTVIRHDKTVIKHTA